jgi:hypothetical protein
MQRLKEDIARAIKDKSLLRSEYVNNALFHTSVDTLLQSEEITAELILEVIQISTNALYELQLIVGGGETKTATAISKREAEKRLWAEAQAEKQLKDTDISMHGVDCREWVAADQDECTICTPNYEYIVSLGRLREIFNAEAEGRLNIKTPEEVAGELEEEEKQ